MSRKLSKTIDVGYGNIKFWNFSEIEKGIFPIVTKSYFDFIKNKRSYSITDFEMKNRKWLTISRIYTGRIKLLINDFRIYPRNVVAILPDLFGENCYVKISAKTIAEAIRDGLLCEDGSFYGPFQFCINGGINVKLITPFSNL
jgi:hypothetical protein